MESNIEVIKIANDVYAIVFTAPRISGRTQAFSTMVRIKNGKERKKWLKYFTEEAERIANDPKYEEVGMMLIETNMPLPNMTGGQHYE